MLKLSVKASQVANLTDARYFAARAVDWLGFNLDTGSENAINPQQAYAIKEWVEGPVIVAEFGLQGIDEIQSIVNYLGVDAIQINMFADSKAIAKALSITIIKEIVIEEASLQGLKELIEGEASSVNYFILDFSKNDISISTLSEASILLLRQLCTQYQLFFNIKDELEHLKTFVAQVNPHGLILLGGVEEKVGYKSFDELDDILDYLEEEL